MINAIIIHGLQSPKEYFDLGKPSASNAHWLPWLQKQLLVRNILAQTPEMPEPYRPIYDMWRETFERYPINESTVLVGHSLGGGFLLRWLSENKVKVDAVALIAPWLDPDGRLDTGFFNFALDSKIAARRRKVVIFYSTDDTDQILESVKRCRVELVGVEYKEFNNYGHFISKDMATNAFPELLSVLAGNNYQPALSRLCTI